MSEVFNYDKRIVVGARVKVLNDKHFLDKAMVGRVFRVECVIPPRTNGTTQDEIEGTVVINQGWCCDFEQVEFVEEDKKPKQQVIRVGMMVRIKPDVNTHSSFILPNGVYEVIEITDAEKNEFYITDGKFGAVNEFNSEEVEIVSNTKLEYVSNTNNANLKIEFFNKETGVILSDTAMLFINHSAKVYQKSLEVYHDSGETMSLEDVSNKIGFRFIVKG